MCQWLILLWLIKEGGQIPFRSHLEIDQVQEKTYNVQQYHYASLAGAITGSMQDSR